ncbi:hypothetical protein [Alkalibacter mobilis]|uniref:hypothetical protein n=1 Tax=Alkalibacter mobilis TaxID=2787712 RepID=UPI0018A00FED|nr:hypothetical protein [Alkalibacter mobilis]MBF7097680.1 hypothetical protein [Alkalibacter mobilis]
MNINFIDNIPFNLNKADIAEKLKLRSKESLMEILDDMIKIAISTAIPKGVFFKADITGNDDESIEFAGEKFSSSLLSEIGSKTNVVYPYIITCGMEIEEYYKDLDDIMEQYILDGIQGIILEQATEFIAKKIREMYDTKELEYHIPGALNDWDLIDQPRLFGIFGDTENLIGVKLSHSNLMKPTKSVSGIYYESYA